MLARKILRKKLKEIFQSTRERFNPEQKIVSVCDGGWERKAAFQKLISPVITGLHLAELRTYIGLEVAALTCYRAEKNNIYIFVKHLALLKAVTCPEFGDGARGDGERRCLSQHPIQSNTK